MKNFDQLKKIILGLTGISLVGFLALSVPVTIEQITYNWLRYIIWFTTAFSFPFLPTLFTNIELKEIPFKNLCVLGLTSGLITEILVLFNTQPIIFMFWLISILIGSFLKNRKVL